MEDDEILISIPVKRKEYYQEDVLKAIIKDGDLVYKNGENFMRINMFEHQDFIKEYVKMVDDDIKKFNKKKTEAQHKK